ncbi:MULTISPECIES: hypothetical protein [unclassified Bacillus (in: firmicutes)]|uniref:DUF7448 domain-containing protein n=1 Tax=unclassified Bacillus (in: firmicutes) TaxID=185979 RepID=UPI000BF5662C|nr:MULTISPECIES: hypothetical protein [unclassified Bacillus (in: firmicutes)]PEU16815.1 hypothetical protein CN524_03555 [Bacillus sp. AFS019443]PFW61530.1 hypothetical protein COL20_16950 [Bacillus sp. AFS075034]
MRFMNDMERLLGKSGELPLLIGKTIEKIYIGNDDCSLQFVTNEGVINWETEGGYSNYVWFEHLDDLDALIGGTVIEVDGDRYGEWKDISDEDEHGEVLEQAFLKIKTNKGVCTIEVRNSHNGFYGGRVNEELSEYYKEYFEYDPSWKELKEEF